MLSEYDRRNDERREKQLGSQPVKHLGRPAEVAEVGVMLVSGRSSYITGQTIVVDGGYLLSSM